MLRKNEGVKSMAQANGFSWRLITENTEEKLLDFSVNVNPLGIPGTVKSILRAWLISQGGIQTRIADICVLVWRRNIRWVWNRSYAAMERTIYYTV